MTNKLEIHFDESGRPPGLRAAPFVFYGSRTLDRATRKCALRSGQWVDSAAKTMRNCLFATLEVHVAAPAPVASFGVAN